jgi:hypothetical protein
MVLARWQRTIVDDAGNILPGAQVTVRREVSGAPLAVLYSDRDGTTPLGNPFTADAITALAAFHAAGGAHRIDVVSGAFSQQLRYVAVGTMAEQDADAVSVGYADFIQISEPSTPSANVSRAYARDVNGVTHLFAKDSSGRNRLLTGTVLNILEFGAVGDGDDTAAIQAALAAVPSTGGVVLVPVGTFRFTDTLELKSKTALVGQGWGSILLGDDIPLTGNARIGIRESATSNVDMAVLDLCVDISALSGDSGGHKAIQFNDSSRIRVEGCRIRTTGTGIAHVNCSDYWVVGNTIETTEAAPTADGGIDQWWGSHDGHIIGNTIEGGEHAILATGTDTTVSLSTPVYNLTIADNIIRDSVNVGIWLQGSLGGISACLVKGNIIDGVEDFHGIRLSEAESCIVRGNHIRDTAQNGIALVGETSVGANDCLIEGNILEDINSSGQTTNSGAAIRLGSASTTAERNRIVGNAVVGTTHRRGIAFESTASDNDAIGNTIAEGTGSPAYIQDSGSGNKSQLNRGPVADFATLELQDSNATHKLSVSAGSNLTANRTLTLVTGDANRTLDISAASVTVSSFGATVVDKASAQLACATLQAPYVIAQSGAAVSHTGDTNETALATIPIPAGAMGANGALRITTIWSVTNSGNNKTPRIRLGGLAGTAFMALNITANATLSDQRVIRNRNNEASQVCVNTGSPSGGFGLSTAAVTTGAVNTASAQDLVISGQLANSGETITLEAYTIEVMQKS